MPLLWSRHATLPSAERARRFQPDPDYRWRILLSDHPVYPYELYIYRPPAEEVPPMTPAPKLQPGALRDALAAASEHTRGGQPFTAAALQRRLGISPVVARERLANMARLGMLEVTFDGGERPTEYAITDQGRAMLA